MNIREDIGTLIFFAVFSFLSPASAAVYVDVFSVPDEGIAPLTSKIYVRASATEGVPLKCVISFEGLAENGIDWSLAERYHFTLEPPYPEVSFDYTYHSHNVDYQPIVQCDGGGAGVLQDRTPITVHPNPSNQSPLVEMTVPQGELDAGNPVDVTIRFTDPDEDRLNCRLDFGEHKVDPVDFTVDQFQTPYVFSHRYRAPIHDEDLSYDINLRCKDDISRGASVSATATAKIVPTPGNAPPSVRLVRSGGNGPVPRNIRWTVDNISDPDNDDLECILSPFDGKGDRRFSIPFPYQPVVFDLEYIHAIESAEVTLVCADGHGNTAQQGGHWLTHLTEAPGNNLPNVSLSSTQVSGNTYSIFVNVSDPDGDTLDCELDLGLEEGIVHLSSSQTIVHEFTGTPSLPAQNSYPIRLYCEDGRGGFKNTSHWVVLNPFNPDETFDPIIRIEASPDSGIARLSVSFFITGEDPDGEDINCTLDFDDASNLAHTELISPANEDWIPHSYFMARATPYTARLDCSDNNGGFASKSVDVQVERDPSHAPPTINSFQITETTLGPGSSYLDVDFSISAVDSDSPQIGCAIDFGDGSEPFSFVQQTPLSRNQSHRYTSNGVFTPRVYCCDDVGFFTKCGPNNIGYATATTDTISFTRSNTNPVVQIRSISPTSGPAELNVELELFVDDAENDLLHCQLNYGLGEETITFDVSPAQHGILNYENLYEIGNRDYTIAFSCQDDFGGSAQDSTMIHVDPPINNNTPPEIVESQITAREITRDRVQVDIMEFEVVDEDGDIPECSVSADGMTFFPVPPSSITASHYGPAQLFFNLDDLPDPLTLVFRCFDGKGGGDVLERTVGIELLPRLDDDTVEVTNEITDTDTGTDTGTKETPVENQGEDGVSVVSTGGCRASRSRNASVWMVLLALALIVQRRKAWRI